MPTLDQILNYLIPIGIVIFLVAVAYNNFKSSFSGFYDLLKKIWDKISGSVSGSGGSEYETVVTYGS
jgi:hypothetical protein